MSSSTSAENPRYAERILVLVKGARDGALTAELLREAGVAASVCSSARDLCAQMEEGAAAALLAEEVLGEDVLEVLRETLSRQPPWSDFPLIVFSSGKASDGPVARAEDVAVLGNVTFLDRPVRARSMVAAVHSAIRSRRRQYEARRAIDSRDRFLAMLGHELRNPLGAIRLGVAVLLGSNTSEPPRALGIIDRQSAHLARLVDDLLDVARVTHGKVVLRLEELDLVEVVRYAFEAQEARARERGLTYELNAPNDALGVRGDRQRLEQVLANLLTNAIKYTKEGGTVTVTVRAEDGCAVLEVADTGIGIAPEMLDRVFDAFAQADRALDRADGGIGLGLALVRSVVQLHGGSVHASSAGPGRGSSFVVRLPEIELRPAVDPSSPRLEPRRWSKRVVVVEDSADNRELLADLLACQGHKVSCAEDGPHGLDEILRLAPDVAFVDLGLPGFDGFELARRARAAGSSARLVAVTGYGQPEDRRRAFDAGFDDHMTKPVAMADVQRAVLGAS